MIKNVKIIILIIITILITLIAFIVYKYRKYYISQYKYGIGEAISSYDLKNNREEYIDYLKGFIEPEKLKSFVYNDYITFSQYKDTATGYTIKNQMEFKAYKSLFMSMFDKERVNFEDCPVTENFKEKFNTNLLNYFNLVESEDCESDCLLNREDKEITVEIYGNFKNTEPTYWTTHHFHYTLDDEGNVDDVVFDYTEK